MTLDRRQVSESLTFDPASVAALRQSWLRLMNIGVWGELSSPKIGAMARMRKRLLEVGENLRSLFAPRDWIPQPREQLKSALGSGIKLRDSLMALERAAALVEGGADFPEFEQVLLGFYRDLLALLEQYEARWAGLLDSQYGDAGSE